MGPGLHNWWSTEDMLLNRAALEREPPFLFGSGQQHKGSLPAHCVQRTVVETIRLQHIFLHIFTLQSLIFGID